MALNEKNGLEFMDFLIGKWLGTGEGIGENSQVENTFQWAIGDHFIQSVSKFRAYNENGEIVDDHQDLGMFSYDTERSRIILREFYSEGYVNCYVMESGESSSRFTLTSERTENTGGMMARQTIEMISETSYTLVLELAKPGGEFQPCLKLQMEKVMD